MQPVIEAVYHIRSDARAIEERAHALAIEQSIEMPLTAVEDDFVLDEIVGRVLAIDEIGEEVFAVRVALAAATVGEDAGQLINMLFGNSSIHDDVVLHDVAFPPGLIAAFGGPRHGLDGLRSRLGASRRALTCTALKPQGLPPAALAALAARFAAGGIDYIKDDHGLADQAYAPFAARLEAITQALRRQAGAGVPTRYVPSLSGDLDRMRAQLALATAAGLDTVMIAPMVAGLAAFHTLVKEHPGVAFLAHPSLAGAARIAPPLLCGKLFRLLGADAVIFPNYGGRFGYSPQTCRDLAAAALAPASGLKPSAPVPAGGMTRDRVGEMLEFYGADVILLIGGALLAAGEGLVEATADFVAQVQGFGHGPTHRS